MKRTIAILILSIGVASAAPSPGSLAGTVFREKGGITALRLGWERTIIFKSETEFTYVKALAQSFVSGNWRVETAPPDGTYVYTKTGTSTGELTFSDPFLDGVTGDPDNRPRTLKLDFVDEATNLGGDIPRGDAGRGNHDFFGRFALTRLSTIEGQSVANVSMRGKVSAENPLMVGFVLQGDLKDVLIRVVGPSLRTFGVSQPWANPRFELYRAGSSTPLSGGPGPRNGIAHYDDWSAFETVTPGLLKLFAHTGAFPLEVGSSDAVGVSPRMATGAYTVVCSPENNDAGGEVLVEIYVLP